MPLSNQTDQANQSNHEIIKLMRNHRSIRKFDAARPVPDDTVKELIETAQCTSTSSNLQAYSVILVKDKAKRAKIAELANHQQHIVEATVFLVFCADLYRLKVAGEIGGMGFDTDHFESFLVSTVDVALMAQTFMLAAESMQMGGVFIGGIRNNMSEMISILQLPELTYPVFGMCIGYPDANHIPDKKPRFETDTVLHIDAYSTDKAHAGITQYDRTMQEYFARRDTNQKSITWSEQVSAKYHDEKRVDIYQVIEGQKFGLK